MIHPSAIIDDGAKIGAECRIWHFVHVCSGATIGDRSSLGQGVFVGGKAIIGTTLYPAEQERPVATLAAQSQSIAIDAAVSCQALLAQRIDESVGGSA